MHKMHTHYLVKSAWMRLCHSCRLCTGSSIALSWIPAGMFQSWLKVFRSESSFQTKSEANLSSVHAVCKQGEELALKRLQCAQIASADVDHYAFAHRWSAWPHLSKINVCACLRITGLNVGQKGSLMWLDCACVLSQYRTRFLPGHCSHTFVPGDAA